MPKNSEADLAAFPDLDSYLLSQSQFLINAVQRLSGSEGVSNGARSGLIFNLGTAANHLAHARQYLGTSETPAGSIPVDAPPATPPPRQEDAPDTRPTPTFLQEVNAIARIVEQSNAAEAGSVHYRASLESATRKLVGSLDPALLDEIAQAWSILPKFERRILLLATSFEMSPERISLLTKEKPELITSAILQSRSTLGQYGRFNAISKALKLQERKPEGPEESAILVAQPHTEISWRSLSDDGISRGIAGPARIYELKFGKAVIAVRSTPGIPMHQRFKCAILAAAGLSSKRIGRTLFLSEDTIKTHLRIYFEKNLTDRNAPKKNRAELIRHFIDTGIFEVVEPSEMKWPSQREAQILSLIIEGQKNEEIGRALYLSEYTIKTYMRRIFQKQGVNSREQLVLLYMSSRIAGALKQSSGSK